jgi:hypothetical protein
MRLALHRSLLSCLVASLLLTVISVSAHASFGVREANFEAGTCSVRSCTYASVQANHGDAYTQAAGHPPYGITGFEVNSHREGLGNAPDGALKSLRVDVPPGLAANPEAIPQCPVADFERDACTAETQIGENEVTVFVAGVNTTLTGAVYNLQQPEGVPLEFGIHIEVPLVANEHLLLVGHLSWNADYHEYFEINNISRAVPVLKSKLYFFGTAGSGFLTLPSVCSSSETTHLRIESWEREVSETDTHTPVGVEGCGLVPFSPLVRLGPQTTQSDQPDGAAVKVIVPQSATGREVNSSDLRAATVSLPEGMTLNPPAAQGLQTCTSAQIAIGSTSPVSCPDASKLGTVLVETPDLPTGVLRGNVYLGGPQPITGPPFTVYLDSESARYGISVRLRGTVNADPTTGRLTTTFSENPQLPFHELIVTLNGGPTAPVANPLLCGAARIDSVLTPFTGTANAAPFDTFAVDADGRGGVCGSPLPFALTQSTQVQPATAGANTAFTFGLTRPDGQQYLSEVSTTLPPGLVGMLPSVPLCGEPQGSQGTCSSTSQIGTATVTVGAGSSPLQFSGPVYLTGPYAGSPFGLSIPVLAQAGPFDFGMVLTRAKIDVDQNTARLIITSPLPTIVSGVPLRLRSVNVAVNRPNFMINPTNCGPLSTDSLLSSTLGGTQGISTPFAVSGCAGLAFTPSFSVSSSANTSRTNGAALEVRITQASGQANIRSVFVSLPSQLPARLTTLRQACPDATFSANPTSCPAGSVVGQATAITPVLPTALSGPAYLVSHGGAAFPDLEITLSGDGVRVLLDGQTRITGAITSSTFSHVPDVPISSFRLDLPAGPHSALAANGSLCAKPLIMPTVIEGQNGAKLTQSTRISVAGCHAVHRGSARIKILSRRLKGHTIILRVSVPGAGSLSAAGRYLRAVHRTVRKRSTVTLRVKLSRHGLRRLRHHRLRVRVKVKFLAKGTHEISRAATLVNIRH